jgi:ribonucleoside-diphosphate reductase beta chain
MSLLKGRNYYKPFKYPQFYNRWNVHEKSHWLPSEVPMHDDVNDWNNKLNNNQKDFLTNIFRFFTQGDVDVASAYYTEYLPFFKLPEVTMMMGGFAGRESVHIDAYSYLLETLGMPEATYKEFLMYEEMKNKQDYIKKFSESKHLLGKGEENLSTEDKEHIAAGIALFSGFTEGMQLFSTFAMLLIFPLNGLMKGMGKIIDWSMVDESQHTDGMIELFKVFVEEYKTGKEPIRPDVLRDTIYIIAKEMVQLEEAFIDLVFKKYKSDEDTQYNENDRNKDFFGLSPNRLKNYIKYIADKRLDAMGYDLLFNIKNNPLPELETMMNAPTHTNFFENRSTDYSNIATTGKWSDIWN